MIGVLLGVVVGELWPKFGVDLKPIGDGFITVIRSVVPVIISATVAAGIAKMGDIKRVGLIGLCALIYFEVVSTIALLVGLVVGNLFHPGSGAAHRSRCLRPEVGGELRHQLAVNDA